MAPIEAKPGLALTLLDLPVGARLSDGRHSVCTVDAACCVDVTRWRLDRLTLALPEGVEAPSCLRLMATALKGGRATRCVHEVPLRSLSEVVRELKLSGLPPGSRLSDGAHVVLAQALTDPVDLLGWDLGCLTLRPPRGWHQELRLSLVVRGFSERERAALGALRLKLLSPNAYLAGSDEEFAQESLPVMNIVVEGLRPEMPPLSVRGRSLAIDFSDPADKAFDDDALAALEKKLRLN
ncbi:hypothetical protein [Niveibacterium terrae]|uniref:hypothetical protein n=1 Tax=Niveibacterium terrae TaxID=3373598 RepID=UPI003A91E492